MLYSNPIRLTGKLPAVFPHRSVQPSADIARRLRRSLPSAYFIKRPALFVGKVALALMLIALGWAGMAYALGASPTLLSLLLAAGSIILNGLMYAHLIELQHECLHLHVFKSAWLHRLFGLIVGLFICNSYAHYRYEHLRHHAYLGTKRNREHFDHRFNNLNSVKGFMRAFFDLHRYRQVATIFVDTLRNRPLKHVNNPAIQRQIKQEYLVYTALFTFSAIASFYFTTWLFVLAWWVPALVIAEGAHFMIEMPEHYGLDTRSTLNVVENTRSIRTSAIIAWYVNGNHTHMAHHFHQGVPMCHVKKLNDLIKSPLAVVETTYFRFYCDVLRGRITHPFISQ